MARKDRKTDVKSNKKMVKNEAEDYSADEVSGPWPRLGRIGGFEIWLLAKKYPSCIYAADVLLLLQSQESGSSVSFSPTPERKSITAGRSTRNRPKKRNLIRWNGK